MSPSRRAQRREESDAEGKLHQPDDGAHGRVADPHGAPVGAHHADPEHALAQRPALEVRQGDDGVGDEENDQPDDHEGAQEARVGLTERIDRAGEKREGQEAQTEVDARRHRSRADAGRSKVEYDGLARDQAAVRHCGL